jgi:hypothetical protein
MGFLWTVEHGNILLYYMNVIQDHEPFKSISTNSCSPPDKPPIGEYTPQNSNFLSSERNGRGVNYIRGGHVIR